MKAFKSVQGDKVENDVRSNNGKVVYLHRRVK